MRSPNRPDPDALRLRPAAHILFSSKSIYKINKITAALFIGANLLAWMLLMVLPLTKYYVSFHDICISFHCMIYGHFTIPNHTFISFTSCKFNAVDHFFPVNFATFDNLCQLLVCKSWPRCRTLNLFKVHIFPTNILLIGNFTTFNPQSKMFVEGRRRTSNDQSSRTTKLQWTSFSFHNKPFELQPTRAH